MHATSLNERAGAYERMAHGFDCLGSVWRQQPDLRPCATMMNLANDCFKKEFCHWAGIGSQQFEAVLTRNGSDRPLLHNATPGTEPRTREPAPLYDLHIADEGRTPIDPQSGERHAKLIMGQAQTPFGIGIFLIAPHGLCGLSFADPCPAQKTGFVHPGYSADRIFADMARHYPGANYVRDDKQAERWATHIFTTRETIELALYGTPFQRQVWRALLRIPAGQTQTYGAVSTSLGKAGGARAVGAAIAANPIAWLVPCHRVLSSDHRLHNYHWGVTRKRAMLVYETAHMAS